MRDGFVFYRGFVKAIRKLKSDADKLALYDAIADYALDGIEPSEDSSELIAALMETIKPQIDANNIRYENGKKGGRPKKETEKPVVFNSETSGFETENQWFPNSKPKEKEKEKAKPKAKPKEEREGESPDGAGSAPSLSEKIISYLNEKTGANYSVGSKTSVSKINALVSKGYTENDIRTVIDKKCADWLNDEKMREHLRPSVLFGAKFEEYLSAPISLKLEKERKKSESNSNLEKMLKEKQTALEAISGSIEDLRGEDGRFGENLDEYRILNEQKAILEDSINRLQEQLKA